jgi:hypothetical protein
MWEAISLIGLLAIGLYFFITWLLEESPSEQEYNRQQAEKEVERANASRRTTGFIITNSGSNSYTKASAPIRRKMEDRSSSSSKSSISRNDDDDDRRRSRSSGWSDFGVPDTDGYIGHIHSSPSYDDSPAPSHHSFGGFDGGSGGGSGASGGYDSGSSSSGSSSDGGSDGGGGD